MAKTSTLHARIDTDLKNNAESILAQLNLTPTDAIKLFYRQVELQGGLPFDLKVPAKTLAERKLFEELEIGERSAAEQGWMSLDASKKANEV